MFINLIFFGASRIFIYIYIYIYIYIIGLKLAKQELKLYSRVMRYANQDQSYPFFRGLDWKACYNDLFSKKSQEMSRKSKEHRKFL